MEGPAKKKSKSERAAEKEAIRKNGGIPSSEVVVPKTVSEPTPLVRSEAPASEPSPENASVTPSTEPAPAAAGQSPEISTAAPVTPQIETSEPKVIPPELAAIYQGRKVPRGVIATFEKLRDPKTIKNYLDLVTKEEQERLAAVAEKKENRKKKIATPRVRKPKREVTAPVAQVDAGPMTSPEPSVSAAEEKKEPLVAPKQEVDAELSPEEKAILRLRDELRELEKEAARPGARKDIEQDVLKREAELRVLETAKNTFEKDTAKEIKKNEIRQKISALEYQAGHPAEYYPPGVRKTHDEIERDVFALEKELRELESAPGLKVDSKANRGTENPARAETLQRKLEVYKERLKGIGHLPPEAPEQIDTLYKIAVLEHYLKDGRIDVPKILEELKNTYGDGFDGSAFATAVRVIDDYVKTGGQNVDGGTGLGNSAPQEAGQSPVDVHEQEPVEVAEEEKGEGKPTEGESEKPWSSAPLEEQRSAVLGELYERYRSSASGPFETDVIPDEVHKKVQNFFDAHAKSLSPEGTIPETDVDAFLAEERKAAPKKEEVGSKNIAVEKPASYRVGTEKRDDGLEYVSIIPTTASSEGTRREYKERLRDIISRFLMLSVDNAVGPIVGETHTSAAIENTVSTQNRFGIETPADEPHIYSDLEGKLVVYGGSPEEQEALISGYLGSNPEGVIFSTDKTGGHRIPRYLVDGKVAEGPLAQTGGFFGAFPTVMGAPNPEEFVKVVK